MNFETIITDIDTYYEPSPSDTISGSLNIKWECEFIIKNWGIKEIEISIKDITGSLFYELTELEEDIKELGFEIKTEGIEDLKLSGSICPNSIEINYRNKTITVIF